MNKYSLNLVPSSFKDLFTPIGVPNRTHGFQIEKPKYELLKNFPPYFLPKLWNDNSLLLKSISKHNKFKKELKKSIIEKYPHAAWCNNALCEDCHPNFLT